MPSNDEGGTARSNTEQPLTRAMRMDMTQAVCTLLSSGRLRPRDDAESVMLDFVNPKRRSQSVGPTRTPT